MTMMLQAALPISHRLLTLPSSVFRRLLSSSGRKAEPPASATKAIVSLFKEGKMVSARKVFDEMREKDVGSFSAMIHGYASNGHFAESFRLFSCMQSLGISANSFTYVSVLVASAGIGAVGLGESIHGRIIKSGLESNDYSTTAMINAYAKSGLSAAAAYRLFREIKNPCLACCNSMISGFLLDCLFAEAFLLFNRLRLLGIVPNFVTMVTISRGCADFGSFKLSQSVHGQIIKFGFDSELPVMNSMLDVYSSFGDSDIAAGFFDRMTSRDAISWTTMMGLFLELRHYTDAFDTFRRMKANVIHTDIIATVYGIIACAGACDRKKGVLLHSHVIVRGFLSEVRAMNSLMTMYAECKDMNSARRVFDRIANRSVVSWTVIISGFVENHQPKEGLRLMSNMRAEEEFDLDPTLLTTALSACSDELSQVSLCMQLHNLGIKLGLVHCTSVQNSLVSSYGKCGCVRSALAVFEDIASRNTVSWNAMISSYGMNGEGPAAVSLLYAMERSGVATDDVTYLNLLAACNHSGLIEDGLAVLQCMLEKGMDPPTEHCGCLVDMLSRAGRLEDARNLANTLTQAGSRHQSVWEALLGGSHIHGDIRSAEIAAGKVFRMDCRDPGLVVQLSNAYASVGKFEAAELVRSKIGEKGLVKCLGSSSVDTLHDVG